MDFKNAQNAKEVEKQIKVIKSKINIKEHPELINTSKSVKLVEELNIAIKNNNVKKIMESSQYISLLNNVILKEICINLADINEINLLIQLFIKNKDDNVLEIVNREVDNSKNSYTVVFYYKSIFIY